jgi:hypothetical protein
VACFVCSLHIGLCHVSPRRCAASVLICCFHVVRRRLGLKLALAPSLYIGWSQPSLLCSNKTLTATLDHSPPIQHDADALLVTRCDLAVSDYLVRSSWLSGAVRRIASNGPSTSSTPFAHRRSVNRSDPSHPSLPFLLDPRDPRAPCHAVHLPSSWRNPDPPRTNPQALQPLPVRTPAIGVHRLLHSHSGSGRETPEQRKSRGHASARTRSWANQVRVHVGTRIRGAEKGEYARGREAQEEGVVDLGWGDGCRGGSEALEALAAD